MSELLTRGRRVYERRFDHEEAARRLAAGETVKALATEYGVTCNAVVFAVARLDPARRAEDNAYKRRIGAAVCEMCGGSALRIVGGKKAHNPDGRILCVTCRGKTRRERFRFDDDGRLTAVRCNLVDCANGERWQPPGNFPGGRRFRDLRPNGIHQICRACSTRMRRESRAKLKVPCVRCGALTSPASDPNRRQHRLAICKHCAVSGG